MSSPPAATDPSRRGLSRTGFRALVWIVFAGLIVFVLAVAGWLLTRALDVRAELTSIQDLAPSVTAAMGDGDLDAAQSTLTAASAHARTAATAASDPLWRVAEVVPVAGPNLSAVRQVALGAESLVDEAALPLVKELRAVSSSGVVSGGAIDVAALESLHTRVSDAAAAVSNVSARLDAVDDQALVGPVADGVGQLSSLVGTIGDPLTAASEWTAVLPGLLGADGPRHVLLVLQNNAELRTGGGITGTFVELIIDDGRLSLSDFADSSEFRRVETDLVPVPESTQHVFTDTVGRFVQNTTMTPDFPLSAELASAWWEKHTGTAPDLILAIDPLVIRALLPVTGPITVTDGTEITQDDFVEQVLRRPYLDLDSAWQTLFFGDLTARFFAQLLGSDAGPLTWLDALTEPVAEGRVSLWSPDAEEQSVFSSGDVAGPLARHQAAGDNAFAVYLNDRTGAKMDTSLRMEVVAATGSCDDARSQTDVRVILTNTAPKDAGSAWPVSMTGGGLSGVTAGKIATDVTIVSPTGWFLSSSTLDGARAGTDAVDNDMPSVTVPTLLAPGESATVDVRFTAPDDGARETPTILHTPMTSDPDITVDGDLDCG